MTKDKNAYRTISEAAREIGLIDKKKNKVNTHTLRFWEKEFKQIQPRILSGNRRYYSNKDMKFLKLIYELLKNQGFTIQGARKLLNDRSIKLDDNLTLGIKRKNLEGSLKKRAEKIKIILNRLKDLK